MQGRSKRKRSNSQGELPVTGVCIPELSGVDNVVADFMGKWGNPGMSVAIAKDGRLIYARGFGYANVEESELVKLNTLFRIASISKCITAVAIMKLIQDGILDIDDKVFGANGILNDAKYSDIKDENVRDITVRNLLQHTGGWDVAKLGYDPLMNSVNIAKAMNVSPPVDQTNIIRYVLANESLSFAPGSKFSYSNFGYCILGRIIEKLNPGMSYEEHVKSSILAPIGAGGMKIAGNFYHERASNEARYYSDFGQLVSSIYGTSEMVPWAYGGIDMRAYDSAGGWITSSIDMLRFLMAIDGFREEICILNPATIKLMTTVPSGIKYEFPFSGYAMGWNIDGDSWDHLGAHEGTCSAFLIRRNDGVECAVLSNYFTGYQIWEFMMSYIEALWQMTYNVLDGITVWPTHDLFRQT